VAKLAVDHRTPLFFVNRDVALKKPNQNI